MSTLNLQFFDVHPQLSSGCDHRRRWQHSGHYVMNWKSTRNKFWWLILQLSGQRQNQYTLGVRIGAPKSHHQPSLVQLKLIELDFPHISEKNFY